MIRFMVVTLTAIGSPVLGIVIPAIVFAISVVATYMLYRHFSK